MLDSLRFAAAAALTALCVGLHGCGIDRGGAPVTVAFNPLPDAAADAIAGPISGKSADGLTIGGTDIDVRNALIRINGMAADLSMLEVGHYAVVEARFTDSQSASATSVDVTFEAIGPVADVQGDVLTVLGQSVVVDAGTTVDPSLDGLDLADPSAVPAVAVSGIADGAGIIRATRLTLDTSGALRLTGFATDTITATSTFTLGAQTIDYSAAAVISFASSGLSEGDRVTATFAGAGPTLTADTLIDAPIVPAALAAGADLRIVGAITGFAGADAFGVAFTPARLAVGARIIGGSAADLAAGRLVNASGTLTSDRRLLVSTLEFID